MSSPRHLRAFFGGVAACGAHAPGELAEVEGSSPGWETCPACIVERRREARAFRASLVRSVDIKLKWFGARKRK